MALSMSSSSLRGARVASRPATRARACRAARAAPQAKYGDEGVYFDLDDPTNTTGSWEMYQSDKGAVYPTTQGEFFERAAQPFQKRDAFFAFSALAFGAGVLAWGLEGSQLAQLPIAKGPTKAAELGPRGKL